MITEVNGQRCFLSSVTRISDLHDQPFEVAPLPREQWANAQYIVGRVTGAPSALYQLERTDGRLISLLEGDLMLGALGKRTATLEGVGDWEAIGADGELHALTSAGLFGKVTSSSPLLPRLMSLDYVGHVMRGKKALSMSGFVKPVAPQPLTAPVILLVGTSMSAGKTTTGRLIIHELKKSGLRIVGAKFTGARTLPGRFDVS